MSAVENRELGFNPWIVRVPSTNPERDDTKP